MSQEPLQIAIVDDFSPDRQTIRRILRKGLKQKFIDHEGALGADALRLCATLAPTPPSPTTILLLDLGLPDMNGLDVLKKLKGNLAMLPLPVVVLTGSLRDADIEVVLAAGAQDFIAKSELTYENVTRVIVNAVERFRLTQKLHVSEERSRQQLTDLQAIYTAAPVGLAVLDSELRYVRLNKYLAEISGLPVEAHIGRTVREISSPFADQFEMQIRQVIETGNPLVDLEMSGAIITQPSIRRTWLGSCYPLHSKERVLIGVNCVLYEVTERVQAEMAEREQRQLAEALRDGLAALTSSLNVQQVMQQILTAAATVVPSEAGSIILFEGNQGRVAHLRGFPPEAEAFFEAYRFPIKSMAHVDTLMKKQPYFVADAQAQSDWLAVPFTEWIRSSIGIPIELHDELIGLLIVDSAIPHHFSAADIDKLCVFARYASLALEKAAYIGKLEERVAARTAELQTAKERVEAILNHSFDGIVLVQPDLHIEQANAAFNQLFGRTADTAFGGSLSDLICQDDMTQVYTLLQSIHTTQVGQHIEIRCYRQNGSVFAAELSIGPIHGDGLVCTLRDITTRKQMEEALRASEAHYRLLADNATDWISCTKANGEISYASPSTQHLGYNPEELIGQSIFHLVHPSDRGLLERFHQEIVDHHPPTGVITCRFHHKAGHYLWMECAARMLYTENTNQLVEMIVSARNITARKTAEEALQSKTEEERAFQDFLKALHEVTIELAVTDPVEHFYQRAVTLGLTRLGFERLGLLLYDETAGVVKGTYGTDTQGNVIPEAHFQFKLANFPDNLLQRALTSGERFIFEGEAALFTAGEAVGDGWKAATVLRHGQQNLGWLTVDNGIRHQPVPGTLADRLSLYSLSISTLLVRKRLSAALQESEEKFRLLLQAAPVAIITADQAGQITLVNHQAERLFGYTSTELLGQSIELLTPEAKRHPHTTNRGTDMARADIWPIVPGQELFAQRKDGTVFPIETALGYVETTAGLLAMNFIMDITRRKQAEVALRENLQKEKELGELKSRFVSMASHEFRTPLASILAITETLRAYRHRLQDDQIDQRLGKIQEQIDYLKAIMNDVLELARLQARRAEFNPVLLDIDDLCRSVLDEFQNRPEVAKRLIYHCDKHLQAVLLDKKLMRQVINNLVSNALKYSSTEKPVTINVTQTPGLLTLTVQDEGIGIPEADLGHLFEPFHRATNVGTISGTGLGLVITKESVELHGGTIRIESQLGVGTRITVQIPGA